MTVPFHPPKNPLLLPLAFKCRNITTRTSLESGQFFDEGDKKDHRNAILLDIQSTDTAANPKLFY
jgi:hypothetical protein